jgi:hypothetical protein
MHSVELQDSRSGFLTASFYPEEGSSTFFRYVGTLVLHGVTSQTVMSNEF